MKRIWIFLCALASVLPGGKAADKVSSGPAPAKAAPTTTSRNLNPEQAVIFIQGHPEIVILDVRTPEEYASGHVAKALNYNYFDPEFQKKIGAMDRQKTYLIYCASGNRSSKAREIINRLNFTNLYHLDGGIKAWQKSSQPIAR